MAFLVEDLKYHVGIVKNKEFSFGYKIGDGFDSNHLQISFTSLAWLYWINAYPGHHSIFHVDGTYKIIKNRYPVIVYGRSDVSGQFHLIAISIGRLHFF